LIKTSEALLKFQQNANFLKASTVKKRQKLQPYEYMDQMEKELKNLLKQNMFSKTTQIFQAHIPFLKKEKNLLELGTLCFVQKTKFLQTLQLSMLMIFTVRTATGSWRRI
jgi:hypothetical protein